MKAMEKRVKEKMVSLKVSAEFWQGFNEFVKVQKSAGVIPSGYTASDVVVFLLGEKMEHEFGLEEYKKNKALYNQKKELKEKFDSDINALVNTETTKIIEMQKAM